MVHCVAERNMKPTAFSDDRMFRRFHGPLCSAIARLSICIRNSTYSKFIHKYGMRVNIVFCSKCSFPFISCVVNFFLHVIRIFARRFLFAFILNCFLKTSTNDRYFCKLVISNFPQNHNDSKCLNSTIFEPNKMAGASLDLFLIDITPSFFRFSIAQMHFFSFENHQALLFFFLLCFVCSHTCAYTFFADSTAFIHVTRGFCDFFFLELKKSSARLKSANCKRKLAKYSEDEAIMIACEP